MKHWLLGISLICFGSNAFAFDSPYFTGQFSSQHDINVSAGALFNSRISPVSAWSNLAVAYHAADPNNSLVPLSWQAWLPPESWTPLSLGVGGTNGSYSIGPGSNFNLANYVQAYAAEGLMLLGTTGEKLGVAIAPTPSNSLSLTAGPQWYCPVIQNSQVLKFNQLRLLPGWYVGANYVKRF